MPEVHTKRLVGSLLCAAAAAMTMLAAAQPAFGQPSIQWRVERPFRLFDDDPGIVKQSDGLLATLASTPSVSAASGVVIGALRADHQPTGGALYRHTHFNAATGLYDAGYVTPKAQTIHAHLADAPAGSVCVWRLDGAPVGQAQPCDQDVVMSLAFGANSFTAKGQLAVQAGQATYATSLVTRDLLVLGLGDSYASGEGNPDRPANMAAVKPAYVDPTRPYAWWRAPVGFNISLPVIDPGGSADWWSPECHRSLMSPQVLAAMRLAAIHPHDSLTFLSFACSGAAVLDGLLDPQQNPPGKARLQAVAATDPAHLATIASMRSQLDQAVDALCGDGRAEVTFALPPGLADWSRIYQDATHTQDVSVPTCTTFVRQPDLIFITIGGNDIGFAGLGAWAILPDPGGADAALAPVRNLYEERSGPVLALVCPDLGISLPNGQGQSVVDTRCAPSLSLNTGARELIADELPVLLNLANRALVRSGLTDRATVVQEAYPQPLTDQDGLPCGTLKSEDPRSGFTTDEDREKIWLAFHALLLWPAANQLDTAVTPPRSVMLRDGPLAHLDETLVSEAEKTGWRVAQSPASFPQHGFCALSAGATVAKEFDFPYATSQFFGFKGWDTHHMKPADWDAYASRQRWIRDVDDSLLTQMVSDAKGDVMDESISGTLHPTAAGEAAVADELTAASASLPVFQPDGP